MIRAYSIVLLGALLWGDTPVQAPESARDGDYPIIGRLVGRQVIVIKAGPVSALYSVYTPEGTLLVGNATEAELQARAPEAHRQVRWGTATAIGTIIDDR
ncbi:MAG: hypothetical protein ACHRHE_05215 [Tepidisphaerales bacterium]